jgi:hypothetical protein
LHFLPGYDKLETSLEERAILSFVVFQSSAPVVDSVIYRFKKELFWEHIFARVSEIYNGEIAKRSADKRDDSCTLHGHFFIYFQIEIGKMPQIP